MPPPHSGFWNVRWVDTMPLAAKTTSACNSAVFVNDGKGA